LTKTVAFDATASDRLAWRRFLGLKLHLTPSPIAATLTDEDPP